MGDKEAGNEPQVESRLQNVAGAVERVDREMDVPALAQGSDEDFQRRLELMVVSQDRLKQIHQTLLVKEEDYGTIPGTDKPTLYQPGCDKLNRFSFLTPHFSEIETVGDGESVPTLRYRTTCQLIDRTGQIVGEGIGSANSWEVKHRYRHGRVCPECGVGAIIPGKYDGLQGGFLCYARKGGCGVGWKKDDPISQRLRDEPARILNPDPFDLQNTLSKMAQKRAKTAATFSAHACGGHFAQDLDDSPPVEDGDTTTVEARAAQSKGRKKAAAKKAAARKETEEKLGSQKVSEGRVTILRTKVDAQLTAKGIEITDAERFEVEKLALMDFEANTFADLLDSDYVAAFQALEKLE